MQIARLHLITISTGSKAIDSLLGGGIRTGFLTDIYGESGSGKSQLCFNLCSNCARDGGCSIFVDTAGTFRPERIAKMAGSPDVLEKIIFIRALNTFDQTSAVKRVFDIGPRLIVVDTLTSLFSVEYHGPARHLALMKYMHALAIAAINTHCAVVVTNMVRNVPIAVTDEADSNVAQSVVPFQQREYLGTSVSIYSHVRLKLAVDNAKLSFKALLVRPSGKDPVPFAITATGISDIN